MDNLDILELIKTQDDWEKIITEDPYNVKVKQEGNLVLLKYNQIDSKKCHLTSTCRGSIIDIEKKEYVCRKMSRFFNYGEAQASEIDWESAMASTKEDGSIISCFNYEDAWRVSTSGTINAFNAEITPFYAKEFGTTIDSFGSLFLYVINTQYGVDNFEFLEAEKGYTHMFELCTPYNKIVTKYDSPKIFYITSRNNEDGSEKRFPNIEKLVDNPRFYELDSLEDCLEFTETFRVDEEGLVVKDKHNNRIKIKTANYINLHHMRGEGIFTHKRALDIIRSNEIAEVLTYFPEFEPILTEVKNKYDDMLVDAKQVMFEISNYSHEILEDRKAFAKLAIKTKFADMCFKWLDYSISVEEYFKDTPSDKLLGRLK